MNRSSVPHRPPSKGRLAELGLGDPTCEIAVDRELTGLRRVLVPRAKPGLTVINGQEAGRVETIDESFVIGRSAACDLCLPDPGISRLHARLTPSEAGTFVEDLGSTNGTFVNGARVEHGQRVVLPSSAYLMLGPHISLRYALVTADEHKLAHDLYHAARRDILTGAFTRKYFFERLDAELGSSHARTPHVSVVLFDFDHFKRVNDTKGHAAGDAVLKQAASAARSLLRSEDVLARVGGEEFGILLRAGRDEATACAERVRAAVASLAIDYGADTLSATISAGVACTDENVLQAQALYVLADARLYAAKAGGRNRVVSP